MSLSILVLAVFGLVSAWQFARTDGSETVCGGVRQAYERASEVEEGGEVPTTAVYADAASAVREAAVDAPAAVGGDLSDVADAYDRLAGLLRGFRPEDPSTYHVYEDNSAAIEAVQTEIDTALPAVRAWLDDRCE